MSPSGLRSSGLRRIDGVLDSSNTLLMVVESSFLAFGEGRKRVRVLFVVVLRGDLQGVVGASASTDFEVLAADP